MKKLYTLLLAAAVTLTAAAATPFQMEMVKSDVQNLHQVEKKSSKRSYAEVSLETSISSDRVVSNISRDGSFPSFDSQFISFGSLPLMETFMSGRTCHLYEDTSEGAGMGYYFLENFIYTNANKIDCTIEKRDVTFSDGVHSVDCLVIPGDGSVKFITISNVAYYLELVELTDEGIYGFDPASNPELLFMLTSDGSLMWLYSNLSIGFFTAAGRGNVYDTIGLLKPNGVCDTLNGKYNSATQTMNWTESSSEVYAELDENELYICMFGGMPCLVKFDLDLTNGIGTAENQAGYYYDMADEDAPDYDWQPAILTTFDDDENLLKTLNVAISTEGGKTKLQVMEPEWCAWLYPNYGYITWQASTVVTLDFDITGSNSGIENTVVADTNAPIEYYNLQGMRVENPTSGLYIKRQGKTATKVLVK